jgi:hypothetical protein
LGRPRMARPHHLRSDIPAADEALRDDPIMALTL